MALLIRMPEVSANVEAAVIAQWSKHEGDSIAVGDTLAEIETDKAVIDFASEHTGILGRILVEAGNEAEVGEAVAILLEEGDSDTAMDGLLEKAELSDQRVNLENDSEDKSITIEQLNIANGSESTFVRVFASPLARRLAQEGGIKLNDLQGSGPHGRIVKRDIIQAQNTLSQVANHTVADTERNPTISVRGVESIPHSTMRRTIARRLSESKQNVPHFYLQAECCVNELLNLRMQVNQLSADKISINDFIVKAAAKALHDEPDMNVSWTDEALLRYQQVDISVAVATEFGLITPIVIQADKRTVSQLSQTIKQLAERAKNGQLQPEEYQGGSFTISNLGMYGVENFAAIINPPQAGILAVGAIQKQPVVGEDGEIDIASILKVTLSVDHRAVDGAVAAKWLAVFKAIIENPLSALV